MSLRSRLLVGLVAIVLTFGVAAGVVATSQHRYLIRQVDRQLEVSAPIANRMASGRPTPPGSTGPDSPFSELFVALVSPDGSLGVLVNAGMLSDTPNLTLADVRPSRPGRHDFFTVKGANTSTRFRVHVSLRTDGTWLVNALPLNRTEAAINRLLWAFGISLLVIVMVCALVAWWFVRLGLRPIRKMTEAADAVTAGSRGERVDFQNPRTETGRLGRAFNVMLDERQASEDRLRQFVADASHELRTPITSIRGYVDLYQQHGLDQPERLADAMRRMGQEAGRMGGLVEDLLLLANLDQGRPLAHDPVDIGQLLIDAGADALATQPGRQIRLDAPPPGSIIVDGDEARLRQVIGILVHNALVHTPDTATISLSAQRSEHTAVVMVSDDGPGMSDEDAARAFERFFRGDPSRSRHRGGSGLGLSIAKSIVEAHHGRITLVTEPGAGCRFTITLPV